MSKDIRRSLDILKEASCFREYSGSRIDRVSGAIDMTTHYRNQYDDDDFAELQNDPRFPLNKPHHGNTFVWKHREFWCGAFDVTDGDIAIAYPYYKAYDNDFHHNFYFDPSIVDGMKEGRYQFFFVDRGKVQTEWREEAAHPEIIASVERQITIL